jgi:hypothetical protein
MKSLPRLGSGDVVRWQAAGLLDFDKAIWGCPSFGAVDQFTKKHHADGKLFCPNYKSPPVNGNMERGHRADVGLWYRLETGTGCVQR